MKNKMFFGEAPALVVIFCITFSYAQWTPDPFCPYPSDHVTRYPYYGNCSVYWECFEGTKYVMECPEGLEFNAPLQECDAPEIAHCDPFASTTENPNPPTYTTISTSSHGPEPDCPFPSEDLIYFPYPGDCTRYWECFEGDAYLYTCPGGLWWHEEISECDYPGDFCDNSTVTVTTPTPTTPHGQPSCETGESGFYPYPGDCTRYWECVNGDLYLNDCPEGLWWHQQIDECDYPGDYCNNSTTTVTTPPTTTPQGIPTCEGTGGDPTFYPYDGDCTKYWECANGVAFLGECAQGLWWHQEIQECDLPGDYCDDSPPPSTETSTPGSTQNPDDIVCPDPNDESVYFPYQGDCTKYWECFEGIKYLDSCPDGLWWHQEVSKCDQPGDYCQG